LQHQGIVNTDDVISVLHVDDDRNQQEFFKLFLSEYDGVFDIKTVTYPEDAIDEIKKGNYDVIVTDYIMPVLNGIELSRRIREFSEIPIILYTGQGSEEVAEEAFTLGVDDYLRKEMEPSHYQVLAKRIKTVVEKNRIDNLYRTVIEQTQEALCIVVDKKIVFGNNALFNILGIQDLSDFGENPFKFVITEDREKLMKRFEEFHNEDNFVNELHNYRIKNTSGRILHIEVSTSPVKYYGKRGLISFLRDVTERKILEAEKKETQERLESLIELAPDGIVTADLNGVITSVNTAFLNITGYEEKEIIGKNFLTLNSIRLKDLKNYFRVFTKLLRGNVPPPFEFRYVKKNNEIGWGEAHIGLINVSGKTEFIAILRDVTERKKNEINFRNDNEICQTHSKSLDNNLLVSIGQFSHLIGKELSTHLSIIRNQIYEIQNNPNSIGEILPIINKEIELANLITRSFVKSTDNKLFNPPISDISDLLSKIIREKNLKNYNINLKNYGELTASIDEEKFARVIEILFSKIRILAGSSDEIKITSKTYENYVMVQFTISNENIYRYLVKDNDILMINEELTNTDGELSLSILDNETKITFTLTTINIDLFDKENYDINYIFSTIE
jgi:PAS domain S-box-containing protein